VQSPENLQRSPRQLRLILATAAKIGVDFSLAALKILVDLPDEEIRRALKEAAAAGLVSELRENGRYVFTSTEVHETLLGETVLTAEPPSAEQAGEGNAFYREGDYWTVCYEGKVLRMRDAKGLHYIYRLSGNIGKELPATEVAGALYGRELEAEPARMSVSRGVKAVLEKISREHPDLGSHLRSTIRAGKSCSYTPDPRIRISWKL
jgi:hypothetical protein